MARVEHGFFIFYQRLRSNNAQIATFFTLMIAVMFLFVVVTINITKTAEVKTMVSKAADSGALLLATYYGSYARSLYEALPDGSFGTGNRSSDTKYCNPDWGLIFAIIMVAIAILTAAASIGSAMGGTLGALAAVYAVIAVVGVVAAGYNLYNYLRETNSALKAANKRMRELPIADQFRESAIVKALSQLVTDTALVRDDFDYDEDGSKDDGISRFDAWYYQRLLNLLALERGSEMHMAAEQLRSVLIDQLYKRLKGLETAFDCYSVYYFDEESELNKGPSYPDCSGDPTNACYLDENDINSRTGSADDFISLLYKLEHEGIRTSSSMLARLLGLNRITLGLGVESQISYDNPLGEPRMHYYFDWWVTPKISPPYEEHQEYDANEKDDYVDRLLFWLRGYLDSENDGVMGLLEIINSLSVTQMQDTLGTWYAQLDDDLCYDPEVQGYIPWCTDSDGVDEEGDVLQEEIEEWVGHLRGWQTSIVDVGADIYNSDLYASGDEETLELYNKVVRARDFVELFRTDLEDVSEHIDEFTNAYKQLLKAEHDNIQTEIDDIEDYKRTAIYSWKQLYQDGSGSWHHAVASVTQVPSELPILYDDREDVFWLCIELLNYTGSVRVDVAKYDPGSSSIYFGKKDSESKYKLWTFTHTYATEQSFTSVNDFDEYDDPSALGNGDGDGCIDETEAYTLEEVSGAMQINFNGDQTQLHNQRIGLLEDAGVKSYAKAVFSYYPEDGRTVRGPGAWFDDFDGDGDWEEAPHGGLSFIIEADGYKEQFDD